MAMFTNLGVPNGEMSFFTTLLYFPWALKFLWAPFVDLIKTKRWWFITMQFLMLGLAVLTIFSIPQPDPATIAAMGTEVRLFTGVLIAFIIMAFASATHDIAADGFYMLALKPGVQAEMIGWRSVFYRLSNVFCNSALIAIPGIIYDWTKKQGHESMPFAWQVTIGIIAAIFIIMAIWHMFYTPRPDSDKPNEDINAKKIIADFGQAFSTFFKKPALWVAILFMLLYRLPEGFLLKMLYPFLFATREMGGLGMSNQEFGIVYGTFGVIFLLIGGILGGAFISRVGLKKAFWWMALGMTLPCLSFVYLSEFMPTNMINIAIAIAIEQFGYGFGFTAYMMYMMYFSDGEYKTSHYAICTSFMALSMILPGLGAGYIQEGTSPNQKSITYTVNDSISLSAPIGYDKDMLYFNGWATITKDSAGNLVEQLVAKPSDTIVVTKNQNLFASFSDMKFIKYSIEFKEPSKNTVLCDFTANTIPAPVDDNSKIIKKQNIQMPIGTADYTIELAKLDTILKSIPLTDLYQKEQLEMPVNTSSDSTKNLITLFNDSTSLTKEYNTNDSIVLTIPTGYDQNTLVFNGWATYSKNEQGEFVEKLYAKPTDTIAITENKNLYASFSKIQVVTYESSIASNTDMLLYTIKADTLPAPLDKKRYDKEKKAEKKNPHRTKLPIGKANIYTDLELDTIFTPIPLTKMYSNEQLNAPTIQSADTSKVILQFTTAEGKMSDYRWFFWMVICCSLATFFVTFLAYKRVDPNYGKK